MTPEERELITGLFDRLAQADTQAKDPEAEQLIKQKVAAAPSAPYLLTQSALVMEHALSNAQERIATLEEQLTEARAASAARPASFLSGLFGGGSQAAPPPIPPRPAMSAMAPAPAAAPFSGGGGGGGFLQTALSTAAGVAGGALLFQGIESLMGHNPGPFAGSVMPSGGVLGQPTEVVNNYYDGSSTPGTADAESLGLKNDPADPDDSFNNTGDFLANNDTGGFDNSGDFDSGGGFDDGGSWG